MTNPVRLITKSKASIRAKRAVGSILAGRTTNRRYTAMPSPITKKSPNRSRISLVDEVESRP